jgi:hypothetical protein
MAKRLICNLIETLKRQRAPTFLAARSALLAARKNTFFY